MTLAKTMAGRPHSMDRAYVAKVNMVDRGLQCIQKVIHKVVHTNQVSTIL